MKSVLCAVPPFLLGVFLCVFVPLNEKCSIFKCIIKKTTHTLTKICDWQRLLHTSTLKLSENHKRCSVCVATCEIFHNENPTRKKNTLNTHTFYSFTYKYMCMCVVVHAAVTTQTSTATAKLPLFMFHAACCCFVS